MTMQTQMLDVTGADGAFQAYFATPDSPRAGLIVIQEIFGVNSHMRDVTERLAGAGFAALTPDLFWREQPGIELGYTPEDVAKGRELKAKSEVDHAIRDVGAAFDVLSARPECRGKKIGVIGFCYGGLITYLAAARLKPACAASYYGGGIVGYLDEADKIDCPIQFHFGQQDSAIPLDQVEQIRAAVSGKDAEIFIYEGAGHGFHCDQRGSYNEASAKVAWERSMTLFNNHLV